MNQPDHVIFSSYGNDSVALIQWAVENGLKNVAVVYSDTGWAAKEWEARAQTVEALVRSAGFTPLRTQSEGMEALVRRKKAWPMCASKMQFCTQALKLEPAERLLADIDPDGDAICIVGIRREESINRRTFPEWTEESEKHGGRNLWAPLVNYAKADRDLLLNTMGVEILPHRSRECFPCVCSNRGDLRMLTSDRVEEIALIEDSMGHTSKGKKRTMFRPYRHMGAIGVREVHKWAMSERGKYEPEVAACDSGMCGD